MYRFGEFSLDTGARALFRGVERVSLAPKEFEALVLLAESAGEAVDRERLMRSIWPDTFVGDTSLARNISVLRKHLGAGAIETIPKFGYRFALPVTVTVIHTGCAEQTESGRVDELLSEAETPASNLAPGLALAAAGRKATRRVALAAPLLVLAAFAAGWTLKRHYSSAVRPARLAVLPFRNTSPNSAETDYLRDGLADELTARLGQLNYSQMRVLARTSTEQYANSKRPLDSIAEDLGAEYLLDGTVAFDQGQAHLTAELVDGRDQTILWSRQFVRPVGELSAAEEEIVEAVANATHLKSRPDEGTGLLPGETVSAEAHDAYLEGRYQLEQKTLASEQQALERFQTAIALDPNYARAYQGISETYIFMAVPHRPLAKARMAALAAVRLNGRLGEAHRDLGWILFNEDADLSGAEAEYQRALALSPNDARAHHWYSFLLAAERRSDESLREATTGYQLDPRSLGSGYSYAAMLIEAGKAQAGVSVLESLLQREPSSDVAWGELGIGYARLHEFDKSAHAFEQAESFSELKNGYVAASAYPLSLEGQKDKAEAIVGEIERKYAAGEWVPGVAMVDAYIGLGNREMAFMWLERGVRDRSVTLFEANTDPIFTEFAADPRFQNILAQLRKPK